MKEKEKIGKINYLSQYLSRRTGSNSWSQNKDLIDAWRRGSLIDVKPLTLEYAPNLRCNQNCRECPYRMARREASGSLRVPRGEFVQPDDDVTVATYETSKLVLDRSAEAGIKGVIWTGGGEPCIWQLLPEMIYYAGQLGMVNGLYTNDIQIGEHEELAYCLLEPDKKIVFIRVSINAVSTGVAEQFSGASEEDVKAQIAGLAALLNARQRLVDKYKANHQWIPSIDVSVIVDERNVEDLFQICTTVAKTVEECGGYNESNDNFVVRPLTKHCRSKYNFEDHDDSVIRGILDVCGKNGIARPIIESVGIKLQLGFGLNLVDEGIISKYGDVIRQKYKERDYCWAIGLFLTVGPDATVHLCCDRNCYQEWTIGNLKTQSVDEIYHGKKRLELLQLVHSCHCGPAVCEATCRTPRLNKIAKAIMTGELTDADIEIIRQESLGNPPLLLS